MFWASQTPVSRERLLSGCRNALLAVAPILPRYEDLAMELDDAQRAEARGYFLPDEDERVRTVFARYLVARAVLHETIHDLRPLRHGVGTPSRKEQMSAFAIAACAACMLMRAGRFMVDNFADAPVVREKLDEAEPRFGIPAQQFSRIYRAVNHPVNLLRFARAIRFATLHRPEIEAMQADSEMAPILGLLAKEEPLLEINPRRIAGRLLRYRLYAIQHAPRLRLQRVMFGLFQASGRAIAEMHNPWKRKRVTPRVQRRLAGLLRPGDVLVTRHDDAMTNLFLPGFWPHSALYIGSVEERRSMGVTCDADREERSGGSIRVLEARKDGVRFRALHDTLAVDCVAVIRPRLDDAGLARALTRAITHEGKLYDFEFDFRRSDRMVCTEVIYRAYHAEPPIHFLLTPKVGRHCLTAEDLLRQGVQGNGFEVIAVHGALGRRMRKGEAARQLIEETLAPQNR